MTSTPQKRAADASWEAPTTLKALRAVRPKHTEPAKPREAPPSARSQSARVPLADLQQPRQRPALVTPWTVQQSKSSSVERTGCQPPPQPQYRSIYGQPSTHASPTAFGHAPWPGHPRPVPSLPSQSADVGPSHSALVQTQSPPSPAVRGVPYKPDVRHAPHPDSRLCQNFHWVPYPLGLLPYDSWFKLHHRPEHTNSQSALCPVCLKERKVTPHARKLFLVAERLSWQDGITSVHDKSLNEELNWAVNYELGILEPFIEDVEQVVGGKNSQLNSFYPYQNEYEMKLAFKYIFMTEDIGEVTWALWIGSQLDLQKMLSGDEGKSTPSKTTLNEDGLYILDKRSTRPKTPEVETIDLTNSPPPISRPTVGILTPQSSCKKNGESSGSISTHFGEQPGRVSFARSPNPPSFLDQHKRIVSYRTLQDFYGLLDKIERTSFVGAIFLEAYAEKLRDDMCKACWLKRNIDLEQ